MQHASVGKGSIIFVSQSLHHALLVPILSEKEKRGFTLIYGKNSPVEIKSLYERYPSVSLLFLDHASNVTGEIYSLKDSCDRARQKGSYVIVDGCQAMLSVEKPLQEFSPHAYFFAGHKMYSHTGAGVLYIEPRVGSNIGTSSLGGGGVEFVAESDYKARPFPYSYESGTHNMGSLVSLREALSYHQKNREKHAAYKNEVFLYAYDKISSLAGFTVYSPRNNNSGILSFSIENVHPHDISYLAGEKGIVLRAGFFCSEIYARHFDSRGLIRISFAPYIKKEDVDYLIEVLIEIQKKFSL
jgi:cysteine desulfurase / selenocysteine lyase